MEYFSGTSDQRSKSQVVTVFVSLTIHGILLAVILSAQFFTPKTIIPQDILDVALFDFPSSGSAIDFNNLPSEMPDAASDALPVEPENSSNELFDPSDAELSRMKRRDENRKAPPRQTASESSDLGLTGQESFGMKTGFLPGGSGRATGSLQLDSGNFKFVYYLAMLKNRISENWIPPFGSVKSDESKKVVVRFRIDRQGRVISPEVEESSGDNLLDQSALRAIIVSGPFPSLPEGYPDATLGVHFGFSCQL